MIDPCLYLMLDRRDLSARDPMDQVVQQGFVLGNRDFGHLGSLLRPRGGAITTSMVILAGPDRNEKPVGYALRTLQS